MGTLSAWLALCEQNPPVTVSNAECWYFLLAETRCPTNRRFSGDLRRHSAQSTNFKHQASLIYFGNSFYSGLPFWTVDAWLTQTMLVTSHHRRLIHDVSDRCRFLFCVWRPRNPPTFWDNDVDLMFNNRLVLNVTIWGILARQRRRAAKKSPLLHCLNWHLSGNERHPLD